jgi:hypothetical protein
LWRASPRSTTRTSSSRWLIGSRSTLTSFPRPPLHGVIRCSRLLHRHRPATWDARVHRQRS